jgi:30S ribosomal protein S31
MGKGDKRTRRGKIFQGSFGKTRPHKKKKKAPKQA